MKQKNRLSKSLTIKRINRAFWVRFLAYQKREKAAAFKDAEAQFAWLVGKWEIAQGGRF